MFERFPRTTHIYNGVEYNITDVSVAISVLDRFQDPRQFDYYRVGSGEKIESVAFNYYKNVDKTYIIRMTNGIVDPIYDWFMSEEMLVEYCFQKYTPKQYYTQPRKIENLQMDWYKNGLRTAMPEKLDFKLGVMLCFINQPHHYEDKYGNWVQDGHCMTRQMTYTRYDDTITHTGIANHIGYRINTFDDPNCELTPVSNYEFENRLNQEKQVIRLLKPEYIGKFESQYFGLLSQLRQE